MSVELDQIVPWGRTGDEYSRMFALTPADLASGILDCGGGPASFTAEATAAGHAVVAVDPIYAAPAAIIRSRFEEVADSMLSQVRATPADWVWTYHRDPDALLARRRKALERFLEDYAAGLAAKRYQVAALPSLPFGTGSFGIALCSHLLFLYSDLLDETFHVRAALELFRVAREVRIFPLLNLRRQASPHVDSVRAAVAASGGSSEILSVDYELQRGGNRMLRLFRTSDSGSVIS